MFDSGIYEGDGNAAFEDELSECLADRMHNAMDYEQ